jgi:amino acid transporter
VDPGCALTPCLRATLLPQISEHRSHRQVPYNDPNLTGNGGKGTPPIVIGADRLGVPVLPHIINAIILTSAWSAGCCLTFTASRNLYAAAINGHAPRLFLVSFRGGECGRRLRTPSSALIPVPINAIIAVTIVSCLSFMTVSDKAITVFTWITNILGGMWILNLWLQNVLYLRFRAGCDAQGIDRSTFPYKRRGQKYFSWICVFAYGIIFLTNGFKVFMKGRWSIRDFMFAYLVLALFIVLYLGHKTYNVLRNGATWRPLKGEEMDFTTGKREIDDDELNYPPVGNTRSARFERWLWG